MQVQPEKIVAVHEGVELRGRGKVKLTITEKSIIAEKKVFPFSSKLATVLSLEYSQISGINQEGDTSIKISYTESSKPAAAVFVTKSKSNALSIMNQISETLQESRRKLEEEAQRKKQSEMDDIMFMIYLYESMINVWSMVSPTHELLSTIRQGEWNKAETHAKNILTAAEELIRDSESNLAQALIDFSEAIKSRSPASVNQRVSEMLLALGGAVSSKEPLAKRWAQYSRNAHPNWSSMSYFLMFALGVNELLISSELGKAQEADQAISSIRRILPVLEVKIGKYLVDGFSGAINDKDIFGITRRVANLLLDELQRYLSKAANV